MATIFTDALVKDVYYRHGDFSGGNPKYIKAPFQILRIPSNPTGAHNTYLIPCPVASDPKDLWNSDTLNETEYMARDGFGFHSPEVVVIEEHEMGNMADNILGLNRFGFL